MTGHMIREPWRTPEQEYRVEESRQRALKEPPFVASAAFRRGSQDGSQTPDMQD